MPLIDVRAVGAHEVETLCGCRAGGVAEPLTRHPAHCVELLICNQGPVSAVGVPNVARRRVGYSLIRWIVDVQLRSGSASLNVYGATCFVVVERLNKWLICKP